MELVQVDELTDGWATLLTESSDPQLFRLPARLLPPDTREGQWLELRVTAAPPEVGSVARQEVSDLMDELFAAGEGKT